MQIRSQTRTPDELDALFAAFCADREGNAPKPLKAWMNAYPDLADELVAWATDGPALDYAQTLPCAPEDAARVNAIGMRLVAEMRVRYEAAAPLTSLIATAKARGLSLAALAAQLEIGEAVVVKLQRRLIRFATIPSELIEQIADALHHPTHAIRAYLRQPPALATGASYKSAQAPQVGAQESFAQAVRDDPTMAPEARARWIDAMPQDAPADDTLRTDA